MSLFFTPRLTDEKAARRASHFWGSTSMKKILVTLALVGLAFPAFAQTTLYSNSTTGDVGIGTATPLNSLEVYDGVIEGAQLAIGTTSTDGLLLANTTAATSSVQQYSPRLHFTGQGWKTNSTAASQSVDFIQEVQPVSGSSAPSGNLVWSNSINGGSYSPLMTLTSGGYVGIGTPTPVNALDVFNNVAAAAYVGSNNTSTSADAEAGFKAFSSSSNGDLIQTNSAYGGYATVGADTTAIEAGGAGGLALQVYNGSASMRFGTGGTAERMRILSGGDVLIGYTSSQNVCCVFQVNGTIGATAIAITSLSDKRLKTDIAPLGASLPIIMALNPVSFQFVKDQMTPAGAALAAQQKAARSKSASVAGWQPKPDVYNFPVGTQVGFTAQDVAEAVKKTPYLSALVDVPADPNSDYYTLREGNMIPLLVKAIQEQQQEIAAMKAKLGM